MKNLVIVESPNKTATIEKYLGKDFKVIATVGHIRDISTKGVNGYGVTSLETWEPKWAKDKKKEAKIKEIIDECTKADSIFIATDPDREGEAIGWHVKDIIKDIPGYSKKKIHRVAFHEITKDEILKQINNIHDLDQQMIDAQMSRRLVDRIIGFDISKAIKPIGADAAGRVQTIVLKLIADREKEIKAFKPKITWSLNVGLDNGAGVVLRKIDTKDLNSKNFKFMDEGSGADFIDKKAAHEVLENIKNEFKVYFIDQPAYTTKQPHLPFKTSTLQQDAANKMGYGSSKTMGLAQMLFEGVSIDGEKHGLITYPRTDSDRMSDSFIKNLQAYILKNYGEKYLGSYDAKKILDAKAKSVGKIQDAHEAIRVSDVNLTPEKAKQYLKKDEYNLYKLIWVRTVASLMTPARLEKDVVRLLNNDKEKYKFYMYTSKVVFDGYRKIYSHFEEDSHVKEDISLKGIKIGDTFKLKSKEVKEHTESYPPRYTDAKLVKTLEESGIGRPSTYASMIKANLNHGYIAKGDGRAYIPTKKGVITWEILEKYFTSIFNLEFTSKVEKELDKVEGGSTSKIKLLTEFYGLFKTEFEKNKDKIMKNEKEITYGLCPSCKKGQLVEKSGRFGRFLGCSLFNKEDANSCHYHAKVGQENAVPARKVSEMPDVLEICVRENICAHDGLCPESKHPLLVRVNKRKQQFVGCSGFPKCRYLKNLPRPKKADAPAAEEPAK